MHRLILEAKVLWRQQSRFILVIVGVGALLPWGSQPVGLLLPFLSEVLYPTLVAYLASSIYILDRQVGAWEFVATQPCPTPVLLAWRCTALFCAWLLMVAAGIVPCSILQGFPRCAALLLSSFAAAALLGGLGATLGFYSRSASVGFAAALLVMVADRLLVGVLPPLAAIAPLTRTVLPDSAFVLSRTLFLGVGLSLLGLGAVDIVTMLSNLFRGRFRRSRRTGCTY